jgi:hypothetical protein
MELRNFWNFFSTVILTIFAKIVFGFSEFFYVKKLCKEKNSNNQF